MTNINTKNKNNRGFTLIETLVAISVLIVAVVVPLRIVSQSVKSATYNRERLTAVYIAQEGLELMHQKRDNDALSTYTDKWGWVATSTNAGCGNPSGCSIEPTDGSYQTCLSTSPCKIYFDDNVGNIIYTHDTGASVTPFHRSIRVFSYTNPNSVKVTSVVTWRSSYLGRDVSVALDTWLYNIYE